VDPFDLNHSQYSVRSDSEFSVILLYIRNAEEARSPWEPPGDDVKTLDGTEMSVPGDQGHSMMPRQGGNPEIVGRNGSSGGL
jgi:hypothetical protein